MCHRAVLRGRRTGGLEFQLTSCRAALGRVDVGGPFCGQGALAHGLVSLPHHGPPGTVPEALLVADKNTVASLPLDWSSVTAQRTLPLTRGCPALVLVPVGRAEGEGSCCVRGVAAVRVFQCQAACRVPRTCVSPEPCTMVLSVPQQGAEPHVRHLESRI